MNYVTIIQKNHIIDESMTSSLWFFGETANSLNLSETKRSFSIASIGVLCFLFLEVGCVDKLAVVTFELADESFAFSDGAIVEKLLG